MKKLLLLLFLFLLVIIIINVESASAQVTPAPDWQFGPGWNGVDTPTPSPSATPTATPIPTSIPTNSPNATPLNVVTNVFMASLSALGMFAVVPIISTAGLIIGVVALFKTGEEVDPRIIV